MTETTFNLNNLVLPHKSIARKAFNADNNYLPAFVEGKETADLMYQRAQGVCLTKLVNDMGTWSRMPQGAVYWSNVSSHLKENAAVMNDCVQLLLRGSDFSAFAAEGGITFSTL